MDLQHYPPLRLFIDGTWIGPEDGRPRDHQPVHDPATGDLLGQLPHADAADIDRALAAAQRGYALWRATAPAARAKVLRGAADWLRAHGEAVARTATREQGKPLAEMRIEVQMAADTLEWYGEEGRRAYGRVLTRNRGTRSLVVQEPIGPVAAFAPWNFPLGNPARKIGAALGAGCSVILKAPEEAPASAMLVVQALVQAGLPAGVVGLLYGVPDAISRQLLGSRIIRKVSFTGSTVVGRHLMKLAAEGGQRTTMELGGHAPVLVFDDADIELALNLMVAGKYRNAGQVCVSPTRFLVQSGVYERFLAAFAERASRLVVGHGLAEGTQMGPLAHPRRLDAMQTLVSDAVAAGARRVTGGQRLTTGGYANGLFWQPTVLADVPLRARIMNEEPFGPVALVNRFETFDEAVAEANRLPFGLAAYAFTESARTALLLGDAIECGMLGINSAAIGAVDAPFGGVKDSGHGSEGALEGLQACLVTKQITQA